MLVPLSMPDISELEKKYVMEVLDSGQLSFGPKLKKFEESFYGKMGCTYAVAVNSGTSALHLAVKSLGLKQDDEVITTPYSFIASSNCLLFEQVRPVFVDIDKDSLNMDVRLIEKAITSKTKAILVVHIFGQPVDMDEIMRIAKKYKLKVIEDACEAIGADWKGKPVGSIGDVGIFAFYPNKQITTGEGGILITNNEEVYKLASSYRNQGRNIDSEWLAHDRVGYNYRMSDLQAAVGLAQMERLEDILKKRSQAAERYLQLLRECDLDVLTPTISPHCKMSWFVFVVILPEYEERNLIIEKLSSIGVHTKPYFPSIHLQPCYRSLFSFQLGDYPVTEHRSKHTLAIPFYSNITMTEQKYVIHELANVMEGGNALDHRFA